MNYTHRNEYHVIETHFNEYGPQLTQTLPSPSNNVVYMDCDENTIFYDEKLSSFVRYVRVKILIIEPSKDEKESYDKCSEVLEKKFGPYEPYEINLQQTSVFMH
jgi:hypothetical protein